MTEAEDEALERDVMALLAPGEIDLAGVIVHTDYGRDEEVDVYDATVTIGETVAQHAGVAEWYVYSGNDDPEFASNQHQGLRLADDGFVWECQHLVRDGTFDIVMYYEADVDQDRLLADLEDEGFRATGVASPDA